MADDPIVLHLGGVHGADKQRAWEAEGFWQPNFSWDRREASSVASAGVGGGWPLLVLLSAVLLGSVYYWRARQAGLESQKSVINLNTLTDPRAAV